MTEGDEPAALGPRLELLIESLLFVAPEPVELARLERSLDVDRAQLEAALASLIATCGDRGVRVQRQDDTVQLVTAPESASAVEKFLGISSQARLSAPALETLAIVAYRQPVTRAQIEGIRGVNCERALATLLGRGLIAETGRQDTAGRPVLYGTTVDFLEQFGLGSLSQLPPLPAEANAPRAETPGEGRNANGTTV